MRRTLSVVFGVLMIIGGIYCLTSPGITFLNLGFVVGVSMVFDGIGRIINWSQLRREKDTAAWILASGILSLVLGTVLLMSDVMQLVVDLYIVYMAAVWLIAIGIIRIVHALRVKDARNATEAVVEDAQFGRHWLIAMIFGILLVAAGLLSLCSPVILAKVIGATIGVSIIIAGANMIHLGTSSWMA